MSKVTTRWAHAGEITALSYTPDGSFMVTASDEPSMHLYPQMDDKPEFNADVIEISEAEDNVFTGSDDGVVRQYDVKTQEFMGIIIRCDLKVRCLAMSPNQTLLAVGTESTDIKIINLEDPEKCWSFKGHKKAVNTVAFDPLGEYLLSSSCDGTVIVWNVLGKNATPIEIINVIQPTTTDSKIRIPVAWHPSNEFFVIGKDKDIAAHHRLTWQKSFTYRTGSPSAVQYIEWSPNGKFLSASSTDGDLWVWQFKEKEGPLLKHKHKAAITDIAWTPNANRLMFADAGGEVSYWEDVIQSEKGCPFSQPKTDPLAGLFEEPTPNVGGHQMQDQEMAPEYLSDNESLNDFIVDDENSNYLEKKAVSAGSRPAVAVAGKLMTKQLHPQFQSGSTLERDERRYLAFNLLGLITTVKHGAHATVSIEFHDKVAHRGFLIQDTSHYSMACLGATGTLFAAVATVDNPSTVFYKPYDSWATKSEWQIHLPDGEDVTAIALNAESAVVATSQGYVRVFSQSGIQTALFSVGSVIAAAGKDDMVLLVFHRGEPFPGSQNLGYAIYNVETGQRIQHGALPVSDETHVTWLGFSEGGIPAFFDDRGVLHILNYYRRVDQGQWTPILDTIQSNANSETDDSPTYWPIGLTDQALACIKCRRGETEPSLPKPFVTELPLKIPTLYQDTPTGQHEETWLRHKILSGLNKDEKIAMSLEPSDNAVAKKELEMDKLAIQMIALACKAERTQKALDLTAMLCNSKFIDKAIEIAQHHDLRKLMDRMVRLKEIKMMEEQGRDPEAERELIMANPVLAAPTSRDQSTYKVSSRQEEQELERRTFQRTEPIQPNDPFGRRIVKSNGPTSKGSANGSGSAGGAGSGAGNPFKKKSTAGGSDGMAPPKGFGQIVKESERTHIPLTRRATDVFEAADYLAADEQRAKTHREQSRQEEVLKKRKAANPGTTNGGQKTLNMFGRPAGASGSTSADAAADAKRFKKQQERQQPGEDDDMGREYDMAMDADDMLEDPREDDEEHSGEGASVSRPPVRVPATQDSLESQSDLYLEETIEETRGHLEKTRVESSLSPVRSSSSVLAGFKFNKA